MIINDNIIGYLHAIEPDGPEWLEQLRKEAVRHGVPVIRREIEPLIRVILKIIRPLRILEIGTGIGYSALFMDSCLNHPQIVTMENYPPRIEAARIHLAGRENISLVEGDAAECLPTMKETFDLIFLDGPKAQYSSMLPDLLRLMSPGGILLADNVLQDGDVVLSRYRVPRRQRTIHTRMREFVWEVKHHPELDSSLIPLGDGIMLARKSSEVPIKS